MRYQPPIPDITKAVVAYGLALATNRKSVSEIDGEIVVLDTQSVGYHPEIPAAATCPYFATVAKKRGVFDITFHTDNPEDVSEAALNAAILQIIKPKVAAKMKAALEAGR